MTNIIKSKIKNVNNSKLKKSKLMSGGINDNIECKEELFTFKELFIKLNNKKELSVVLEGKEKIYSPEIFSGFFDLRFDTLRRDSRGLSFI